MFETIDAECVGMIQTTKLYGFKSHKHTSIHFELLFLFPTVCSKQEQ